MKLMYNVLEKGTRLFSKTARRRNVMLCCLPVNGQLLSTIEKYGGTRMAGMYYNSINNGVIRFRNRYTELTENHDDSYFYIGLTPRSGLCFSWQAARLLTCTRCAASVFWQNPQVSYCLYCLGQTTMVGFLGPLWMNHLHLVHRLWTCVHSHLLKVLRLVQYQECDVITSSFGNIPQARPVLFLAVIAKGLDCLLEFLSFLSLSLSTRQYNVWVICKVVSYKVNISMWLDLYFPFPIFFF